MTGNGLAVGWHDGVTELHGLSSSKKLAQACSQDGGCKFPERSKRKNPTTQLSSSHCWYHLCLIIYSKSPGQAQIQGVKGDFAS